MLSSLSAESIEEKLSKEWLEHASAEDPEIKNQAPLSTLSPQNPAPQIGMF